MCRSVVCVVWACVGAGVGMGVVFFDSFFCVFLIFGFLDYLFFCKKFKR